MNLRFTMFNCFFFSLLGLTFGQVQQVSVGASYAQQAYYNLSTGNVKTMDNEDWDIAFSNAGALDAGVFINESASLSSEPIKLWAVDSLAWDNIPDDTTPYVDSTRIYNPESNWTEGAFNSVRDTSSAADYGWGAYNPANHNIEATKVFIIQLRDGNFKKFELERYAASEYVFRYADLDGSNEVEATVSKSDAGDAPLIYFSFASGMTVQSPVDYDLIFLRYTRPLDAGDGSFLQYIVTGVLLAPGTEAALADGIDPLLVSEDDYADAYSDAPTAIGHEWKFFDFTSGWVVDSDRVYFVKTRNGEKYKIEFFDFEGSSTGITTFDRRLITTTSTQFESADIMDTDVYPNPAADFITIDNINPGATIYLVNSQGQLVVSKTNTGNNRLQLDVTTLVPGMYQLLVRKGAQLESHKVIINN